MLDALVYRILGNDAWPHHGRRHTEQNLSHLLDHEPALPGAEKRWVLNRILSPRDEGRLIELLERRGQRWLRLPFEPAEYAAARAGAANADFGPRNTDLRTPDQRRYHAALVYVANINGARNAAIDDAEGRAAWVLPLDGATAFDAAGWSELRRAMTTTAARALPIPMYRLRRDDEAQGFVPGRFPEREDEPQLAIRTGTGPRFDERLRWGRLDKVELLDRLGLLCDGSLLTKPELRAGWCLRLPTRSRGTALGGDLMARVEQRSRAARWLLWRADARSHGLLGAIGRRFGRKVLGAAD